MGSHDFFLSHANRNFAPPRTIGMNDRASVALPRGGRDDAAGLLYFSNETYFQDIAERSLAKIGASFQSPSKFASATVGFGSWNRNTFTQSSASLRCASPIYFL